MSYIGRKKILTPDICKRGESCADTNGDFLTTTTVYGIIPKQENDFDFLLAILNSRLLNYFIKNTGSILRGGFHRYKTAYLRPFPIKIPSPSQAQKIKELVERIMEFHKQGKSEQLEQQIKNVDYEIDEEVYKLYGISEGEKRVVEGALG